MSLYSYKLLAEQYHEQIQNVIQKNKTVIIKGPTGCGKSTYIPYILKDKKVAVIEPRRIAVTSLYNTLSEKIPNLGFKMRFNSKISESSKMVIYTDGSFLNCFETTEYDYIIIDEVHERSLRTDLLLCLLKTNFRGKLILMSATLDTNKLESFFNAVTFVIPGEGHPINIKYLDSSTSDYVTETYFTIKNILKSREPNEKKDILVFLTGEDDIKEAMKICKKIPSISIYKVHSSMNDKEQMKIYEESNLTRVILSTNVCETSLTIPNIKYVIDSGLCKNKVFDEISFLGIQAITTESAIQRMGRCNRLGPGVCYKLYTPSQSLGRYMPEILRSDVTSIVLFLINLKKNILNFGFIDYPPIKNMILALEFLVNKNCITAFYKNEKLESLNDLNVNFEKTIEYIDIETIKSELFFKITNYGRKIVYHPFDVHLSHFYEQCKSSNIGYYGSILLSLISQENYNFLSGNIDKKTDIEYLIELYEKYVEAENKIDFCIKASVPIKGMEMAIRIVKDLDSSKDGDIDKVQRIFSNCFDHNLCIRKDDGSFLLQRIDRVIYVHPNSGFFKRNDKKIVLVNIFCSSKVYGKIIGKYYQ